MTQPARTAPARETDSLLGTADPRERRHRFVQGGGDVRHGEAKPRGRYPWYRQLFDPGAWHAAQWSFFLSFLTLISNFILFLYLSNLLGISVKSEIEAWIIVSGLVGFSAIVTAVWGFWYKSTRRASVVALVIALVIGAVPAWLVGNTLVQLIIGGGVLPQTSLPW